jgi:hypothetical protein
MTDESLMRHLIEQEAVREAAAGRVPHMEAILARVSAEVTKQAAERRKANPPAVFYTVSCTMAPDLAYVASRLHLPLTALDATFGVALIDADRQIYVVRVLTGTPTPSPGVDGPFADPSRR